MKDDRVNVEGGTLLQILFQKQNQNEAGITLVALIITVIILVILAAVTIITLQQSQMIKYAVEGTEKYTKEQGKEAEEMEIMSSKLEKDLEKIKNGDSGASEPEPSDISVKCEPNGNNEWQKQHSTIVTIEQADKIVNAKYLWTESEIEPEEGQFPEEQTFKSGDTISKDGVTGAYFLWVMLETRSGKKIKGKSEEFNFDNEGPSITSFTATKSSTTAITLKATARDTGSGITKFEFYIDNVKKATETLTATTSSVTKSKTITGLSTGTHTCKVIVYDASNNNNTSTISGTTKLYAWTKWNSELKNNWVKVVRRRRGT